MFIVKRRGGIAIKDKYGNEWLLEDAVIRILFEKYPQPVNLTELSEILSIHFGFIKKNLDKLESLQIVQRRSEGYQLRRTEPAIDTINRIMIRCDEAIMRDGYCYISASGPRKLFTPNPTFDYFDFPIVH